MKKSSAKPSVLVVDDERDFLKMITAWLKPDYEITCLLSGEALLEEMEAIRPDLLILDVRIPGADGFELCRQIRGKMEFEDLPIIFLTADKTDQAFIQNIDAGGTAFLTKTGDRRELLTLVSDLLNQTALR